MNSIRPSQAYIDESRAASLLEKWAPVLDYSSKSVAPIEDSHTRLNTAMLLENQESWCLNEAGPNYSPGNTSGGSNVAGNQQGGQGSLGSNVNTWGQSQDVGGTPGTDQYAQGDARLPKILIPMIRRTFPELITNEIVGVQPMAGPVGAERFAEFIFKKLNAFVQEETNSRVKVAQVEFFENKKNTAIYKEG